MTSTPGGDAASLGRLAVDLARGAADVVRATAGEQVSVDSKSTATDLVTTADRASERWLVDQLAQLRPDDAVLGEEGAERAGSSGVRWVLDPIDGTVNFVLGLPVYAVSVAAELDGEVVAGAVCNPVSGELFHAVRGAGAFLDGTRLHGPRDVPLERAVVGTGFSYDSGRRAVQAGVIARLLPRIADLRRVGCASLDLCSVACGRLDAYFEAGLHPWDWAAGGLVVREAGSSVDGLRGSAPSHRLVVAAAPALAPHLQAVLTELDADSVFDS